MLFRKSNRIKGEFIQSNTVHPYVESHIIFDSKVVEEAVSRES